MQGVRIKPLATVTLAFAAPRYLLIFGDVLRTVQDLTEEMIEQVAEGNLRIVDLDSCEEVFEDLTLNEILELEDDET